MKKWDVLKQNYGQPMLSPVADHGVLAQTRAKDRREESDNEKSQKLYKPKTQFY